MTLQYCSDLHLEFAENREFLKQNPLQPKGDILLLAGDIVPFAVMNKHDDFFNVVSDNFEYAYWIPGNHEYYYYDAAKKCGTLNEKIKSNVFLVNNVALQHKNLNLIFSTLWSKISAANEWHLERSVSDFQVIKFNGFRLSSPQFNQLHEESLNFITSQLQRNNTDKTTLVVTHHVPTLLHYPEKYKRDALNEAFAVELFDLIETTQPDYWIYGHHHYNTPDYAIGKTKMLTNQLGYVKYGENEGFINDRTITI